MQLTKNRFSSFHVMSVLTSVALVFISSSAVRLFNFMIEIIGYIFGAGFLIWLTIVLALYVIVRHLEDL